MMNKVSFLILTCIVIFALLLTSCTEDSLTLPILPSPESIEPGGAISNFSKGYSIEIKNSSLNYLEQIIKEDIQLIGHGNLNYNPKGTKLTLEIQSGISENKYILTSDNGITINAGSAEAISNGLSTFYQLLGNNLKIPGVTIVDHPTFEYRSLMIDCARSFHSIDNLKTIVKLCQWYKINYLHLHLTDDQLFTFPSTAYPELMTDQHYSKQELIDLNTYANQRGITLIPEIDMPGHASQFIKKLPEVFGIDDISQNRYTITLGNEQTYAAIDTLLGEVAEIFTFSPYIHIGGDEAFFEGMEDDPTTKEYMRKNEIPNIDELFRHFLVKVNDMVKSKNKQMMVWAGFNPKGEIEIPKDVIILLWEPQYYDAIQLQKDGFPFVNVSFKPLYVVNNRKWEPSYILNEWNPRRWESWATRSDTFIGIEIPNNDRLIGATMCSWEQNEINELNRLRLRLPAMVQHLWDEEKVDIYPDHINTTDQNLTNFIRPFQISTSGKKYPNLKEGNFYDHLEFDKAMTVTLHKNRNDIQVRYTTEQRIPTIQDEIFPDKKTFRSDTYLSLQAFDKEGKKVGLPLFTRYLYKPIKAIKANLEKEQLPNSWYKMRYKDSLKISLTSSLTEHPIKYTLDGSRITEQSPTYSEPIYIKGITTLRAQHFDTTKNISVGSAISETYYDVVDMPSLTTGKKSWASNSDLRSDITEYVNDGRITLWEQWGDHLDGNNWVQVDLGESKRITKLLVVNFWDNYRYYQYTISGSTDGKEWKQLVDLSQNTELSTAKGYQHMIEPTELRFLKIHLTYNSANPGLHLIEFGAWE